MYDPYILPAMVGGVASFIAAYLKARSIKQPSAILLQIESMQASNYMVQERIKSTQQEITNILEGKSCSYCERLNKFSKNCEGCGAPCK